MTLLENNMIISPGEKKKSQNSDPRFGVKITASRVLCIYL